MLCTKNVELQVGFQYVFHEIKSKSLCHVNKCGFSKTQSVFDVHIRAAQCIDKEILISKNGNIDIDIEIDKRMF